MLLHEDELEKLLQKRAREGNLILALRLIKRHSGFSRELEETFFKPGTRANEDFVLIMSPPDFFIVIPDTPRNRSAVSVLSHKHKLRLPPLTKFDEYMKTAYQVKNAQEARDLLEKMFGDTLNFIKDNYDFKAVKSIVAVYCSKKDWKHLSQKFAKFRDASTAVSSRNHTVKVVDGKGVIKPKKNYHIIFFNCSKFSEMTLQDMVYNFILTVAHEVLHLCGIRDEVQVHMLEFEVAEKLLGIYHTAEYKRRKRREAESIYEQRRAHQK